MRPSFSRPIERRSDRDISFGLDLDDFDRGGATSAQVEIGDGFTLGSARDGSTTGSDGSGGTAAAGDVGASFFDEGIVRRPVERRRVRSSEACLGRRGSTRS
jgi:hypothetical protein